MTMFNTSKLNDNYKEGYGKYKRVAVVPSECIMEMFGIAPMVAAIRASYTNIIKVMAPVDDPQLAEQHADLVFDMGESMWQQYDEIYKIQYRAERADQFSEDVLDRLDDLVYELEIKTDAVMDLADQLMA